MNTVYTFLRCGFLLCFAPYSIFAQWHHANGPSLALVHDVEATAERQLIAATVNGLYTSFDSGRHWQSCGLEGSRLSFVSVLGNTTLVANSDTIWRSDRSLRSWNVVWSASSGHITALTHDRTAFYMAVCADSSDASTTGGIFHSNTIGFNWQRFSVEPELRYPISLTVTQRHLYALTGETIYVNQPNERWSALPLPSNAKPTAFTSIDDALYACSHGVVHRLLDTSASTDWRSSPLPGLNQAYAIVANGDTVIVATDSMTFISHDGAQHWEALDYGGFLPPGKLWMLKRTPGFVAAASERGLRISAWRGEGWLRADEGIPQSTPLAFGEHHTVLFTALANGVSYSTDHGESWQGPNDDLGMFDTTILSFTVQDDALYAAGDHLFRLGDMGWMPVSNQGAEQVNSVNGQLFLVRDGNIRVSDNDGRRSRPFEAPQGVTRVLGAGRELYCVTHDSLWHLWKYHPAAPNDGWQEILREGSPIAEVLLHRTMTFVARDRLRQSTNNGVTWSTVPGLPNDSVVALAGSQEYIVVALEDVARSVHVYASSTGGSAWQQLPDIGQPVTVASLYVSGHRVILGAHENGVFTYVLPLPSFAESAKATTDLRRVECHLVTQPSSYTAIYFTLASAMRVRLSILDERGRTVLVPIEEELTAGEHFAQLPFSTLPSGSYYYVLETPTSREARLLLVP